MAPSSRARSRRAGVRRYLLGVALAGLATASCSLLVDASGLADGALLPDGAATETGLPPDGGDHPDASGTDSSTDASALPDGAEAGPRTNACGALLFGSELPLTNGDFEVGCANGFSAYNATVTEETTLKASGAIACRVCYSSGPYGFFVRAEVPIQIVVGENYEVVACVRGVPDGDAASPFMPYAEISLSDNAFPGSKVNAGSTYTPVRAAWDVTKAYPAIGMDIRAENIPGACFIVDDVRFFRVRDAGAD